MCFRHWTDLGAARDVVQQTKDLNAPFFWPPFFGNLLSKRRWLSCDGFFPKPANLQSLENCCGVFFFWTISFQDPSTSHAVQELIEAEIPPPQRGLSPALFGREKNCHIPGRIKGAMVKKTVFWFEGLQGTVLFLKAALFEV